MNATPSMKRGKNGTRDSVIKAAIERGMRLDESGQLIMPSGKPYKGTSQAYNGYRRVCLWHEGKKISVTLGRVVCWLTHGPPPHPGHMTDHINGNRFDDRPHNLRWATPSQNVENLSLSERIKRSRKMKSYHADYKRMKSSYDAMREALEQAIARVELANREGHPILSAWLPDARAALAMAKGEVRT